MAKHGWHLTDCRQGYIRFSKGEKINASFAVTYLPDANEYDPKRPEAQEVYIQMCEESGWELILAYGALHIFRHSDPNAIPVETDEALRLQMIERVSTSDLSLPLALTPLLFTLLFFMWLYPIWVLANPIPLLVYTSILGISLCEPLETAWYYLWRSISRKRTRIGMPCLSPFTTVRRVIYFLLYLPYYIIIFLLLVSVRPAYALLILLPAMVAAFILLLKLDESLLQKAKQKYERDIFVRQHYWRTRTILFLLLFALFRFGDPLFGLTIALPETSIELHSKDALPVTLTDLKLHDPSITYDYRMETQKTFLAQHSNFVQQPTEGDADLPQISYSIDRIPFAPLRAFCFNRSKAGYADKANYRVLSPADLHLNADRLIYRTNHPNTFASYLVLFGDCILDLRVPVTLTDAQITETIQTLMTYCQKEV